MIKIIDSLKDHNIKKLYLVYSIVVGVVFFAAMMLYTGFKLSAPLDDAFIYFQYAKNMAQGSFFEFVKGEGYSSGATSFLYVFILTPFAFFLKGSQLIIIVSYFIGILSLFLSGYYIYKILLGLNVEKFFSFFGGVFYITNGNILWGFYSGMEIPVFSVLIIMTLYYILANRVKEQLICLSLLSIVRPEGFFLVVFFFVIKILNVLFNWKQRNKEELLLFLMPLIPGIVYFIINKIFTGDFMPNTMRAKSDFAMYYPVLTEIVANGLRKYFNFLINIYNGIQEHWHFHYSFIIFIFGVAAGASYEILAKKPGFFCVCFLWFFLGTMSTVFSSFFYVHNYRYAMPFMPVFNIIFIYSLFLLFNKLNFSSNNERYNFQYAFIFLFLIFNFFTIFANIVNFGRDCKAIYNQSISAGKWIKQNLPKDAKIAINDIGAITFFSDAKIYDLVGLVTNGQAKVFRDGIAGTYEKLEKVRPDYFMIHLGWFNYERYSFFGLSDKRLVTFNLKLEPPYYVVGSPEVCVPFKTALVNSGDNMKNDFFKPDFVLVDRIDVCDLDSEKRHDYKIWTYFKPDVPDNLLEEANDSRSNDVLIDAGRSTIGGEKFVVYNLTPGKDIKIVRRTFNPEKSRLKIFIDSKDAGYWENGKGDGFVELSYIIPGKLVEAKKAIIELKEENKRKYNSFYYWILQRRVK